MRRPLYAAALAEPAPERVIRVVEDLGGAWIRDDTPHAARYLALELPSAPCRAAEVDESRVRALASVQARDDTRDFAGRERTRA